MRREPEKLKVIIDEEDGLYIERHTKFGAVITNEKDIEITLSLDQIGEIYEFCREFYGDK